MHNRLIYIGEPNDISIKGLKERQSGDYVNDANVHFAVKDVDGNVISGIQNQDMPLISGSTRGEYLGTLTAIDSANIPVGDCYVWITSTGKLQRVIKCAAVYGN